MWNELDMPQKEKINYLAHPNDTSLHNFGAAVDVGIISNEHVLLDMGTEFDSFVELSKPKKENQFYQLSVEQSAICIYWILTQNLQNIFYWCHFR